MQATPITVIVSRNVKEEVWREVLSNLHSLQLQATEIGKGGNWKCDYPHNSGLLCVSQDGDRLHIWRDGDDPDDLLNGIQVEATAYAASAEETTSQELSVEIPIDFTLPDGQQGEIVIRAKAVPDHPIRPGEVEQLRKAIAIGALKNAKIPPDAPQAVKDAIRNTMQRLKAEFN